MAIRCWKLLILLPFCWLNSCGEPVIRDESTFFKWIIDPAHGLKKVRRANGIEIAAIYLPSEYLAYRAGKLLEDGQDSSDIEGLDHQEDVHFLLAIKAVDDEENILYKDITNYSQYKEKTLALNFAQEKSLELIIGEHRFSAALAVWENLYNLGNRGKLNVSFTGLGKELVQLPVEESIELVFADEIFGTGIHHFYFKKEDVARVSLLKL